MGYLVVLVIALVVGFNAGLMAGFTTLVAGFLMWLHLPALRSPEWFDRYVRGLLPTTLIALGAWLGGASFGWLAAIAATVVSLPIQRAVYLATGGRARMR